jgi:hypothetical protein
MASLEKRSVSNLIELWRMNAGAIGRAAGHCLRSNHRGALNLKLDADNPADREKLRRAFHLVAGEKCESKKGMVKTN